MSSWNQVLKEVRDAPGVIDAERERAVTRLAALRGRNVICYYSGWLQVSDPYGTSISDDDMNGLMNAVCDLDRGKGLDLVLHTPGGDLAATEAIVNYIRDCFGNNVCAIVPQMAMSAGTMIACSCREILMGRQSSLGPTDPQLGGVAAGGVVEEFERAVEEIGRRPDSAVLWGQIIGKYHPTFIGDCQKAVEMSESLVRDWLLRNMLSGEELADGEDPVAVAEAIVGLLCDHRASAMHNRHFNHVQLEKIGMHISMLEDDNDLQDAVLTMHHTFMITFQQLAPTKIIESSSGARWVTAPSPSP